MTLEELEQEILTKKQLVLTMKVEEARQINRHTDTRNYYLSEVEGQHFTPVESIIDDVLLANDGRSMDDAVDRRALREALVKALVEY